MFKKLLAAIAFLSITSFTTYADETNQPTKQSAPSTQPSTSVDFFASCAKLSELNKAMVGYGFKPIFVSTIQDQHVSMYVWMNFQADVAQYIISNGERGCVAFRGDKTLFNVPSGLTSL